MWIGHLKEIRKLTFQALPFVGAITRKTLVTAGHVTTCGTNVSTGAESTDKICRSQLKRKKGNPWSLYIKLHTGKYSFEILQP